MSDQKSLKELSVWSIVWPILLWTLSMAVIQVVLFISTQTVFISFLFLTYVGAYMFLRNHFKQQKISPVFVTGANKIERNTLFKLGLLSLVLYIIGISSLFFILSFQSGMFSLILLIYPFILGVMLSQSIPSAVVLFITVSFVIPIVEEWFFRGVLLNFWSEKYSNRKAIFWSAFFFALFYLPAPLLFIPRFLIGLLSALSYIKTKKLIYPILIHGGMNVLILLPVMITSISPTIVLETEFMQLFTLILLLAPQAGPRAFRFVEISYIVFLITLLPGLLSLMLYGKNINEERSPYIENSNRNDQNRTDKKGREIK